MYKYLRVTQRHNVTTQKYAKPKGKRPLGSRRCESVYNIKMDLGEIWRGRG
jgi:hypothetical protein